MFTASDYSTQLQTKSRRLQLELSPFQAPPPAIFPSPEQHYRQRAEFRLWHHGNELSYAMFEQGTKQPLFLTEFAPADRLINRLMAQLKPALTANPILKDKLFQVEFLTTLAGDALISLCYHRQLSPQWQDQATRLAQQLNCQIIGRAKKQKIVIDRDYVIEKLSVNDTTFTYHQPEGCFSQPNAIVNQHMLTWVSEQISNPQADLLEMYCGSGNFTMVMAAKVRKVLASEINKRATAAARHNAVLNNIANLSIVRLSAEELTQALSGQRQFFRLKDIDLTAYDFDYVFVDPPRSGLDAATCNFIKQFNHIIYISCNLDSLAANLAELSSSHKIVAAALFDQFPYTEHLETGLLLARR